MKRASRAAFASILFLMGCGGADLPDEVDDNGEGVESVALGEELISGEGTFKYSTFGGNGRTCRTCHGDQSGTISPGEVQTLFALSPGAPLFRSLDSDDGVGNSYTRLRNFATIRVKLQLPSGVSIAEAPGATSVTLERGIPTTFNTPALDNVLMLDGRAPSLQAQANDAIHTHAQSTVEPTTSQLDAIASYEKTLFSRGSLAFFASGGPAPTLPQGSTDAQKRGRAFFENVPFTPPSFAGFCAQCHSGPMLNQANESNHANLPVGARFANVLVSEFNARNLPVRSFVFPGPNGSVTVTSPDPGRALITGNAADANLFKIPTLWGVKNTAPYFHDNSAATLEAVAAHYNQFLLAISSGAFSFSAQDQADMVAYLKLL